jgi:hypothetical protein
MINLEIAGNVSDTGARRQASTLALAIAGLVGFTLALLLLRGAVATPFSDEFYFFELYRSASEGRIDVNELVRPHFGHMYVLLKSWLWFVVRHHLDWRVSMYLGVLFIAMTIVLMLHYSMARSAPQLRMVVALGIALALGSMRQAENVYWAMQLSGPVMIFFTVAAFYAVALYVETHRNGYAALALVCGFLSYLSTGGGLMSFSLTIFALFVLARKNSLRVACVAVGILFLAGVMSYTRQALEAGSSPSLLSAKNFALYCLAFIANALYSFSERGDDVRTLLLGGAILVATGHLVKASWREKEKHVMGYLLIAFSLASCLAIAYARLKSGLWQPNAPRYYPSAATILLGDLLLLNRGNGKRHAWLAYLVLAMVSLSFAKIYVFEWRASPYRHNNLTDAHMRLCSGSAEGLAYFGALEYTNTTVVRNTFCSAQDMANIAAQSQPILHQMGPDQTSAGVLFNPFNGESAMWMRTENCEQFCTLVFDDVELPVVVAEKGALLTATIPKALYATPGDKRVYIRNKLSKKTSRVLTFKVN